MRKPTEAQTAILFEMPPRGVPDLDARTQALDVNRSWIVEAPAGSGKTGLLIQRYLCLLADSSVTEPEQVLAITFTRAATEEIRDRVLGELRRAREGSPPANEFEAATRTMAEAVLARDSRFAWRLLAEPRRLRVRTIDAVCAEIARALPLVSGGGSSLRPIEDPSSLYDEAARRTWLRLGSSDTALHTALRDVLLHRDGDLADCERFVAGMLRDREQWGSLVPLRTAQLDEPLLEAQLRAELSATLERVVCEGLGKLARAFPPGVLNALTRLAAEFGEAPAYDPRFHPLAICRGLHNEPQLNAEHLAHWRALAHLLVTKQYTYRQSFSKNHLGAELTAPQRENLELLIDNLSGNAELLGAIKDFYLLPPPEFPEPQWHLTKAVVRVLRQSLIDLQLVFAERGECDFTEPALLARYALDSYSATGFESAIGTELKHLLVDEMQDTSTRQYELLERLTAGWADEGKTVFLVGDPKQSIYLFRQARVERFITTMRTEKLGTLPVGLLRLTANFRSRAGLVRNFNHDFSAIFSPTANEPDAVEYVRAASTRPDPPSLANSAATVWHLSVADASPVVAKPLVNAQRIRDARELRRLIERWRNTPLPPGRTTPWNIAVLVRSRSSLGKVLPELQRGDPLPLRALKIDRLGETREILDLVALTRALLHPADRTAWLAVLHAPWCGLGVADLHTLTGGDDPRFATHTVMQLIEERGAELSPDGIARLERSWPPLEAAVRSVDRLRLPELVERTWRSLGGHACLNETQRENAGTFLALLQKIDHETGQVSITELNRRIDGLFAAPGNAENAVDLVTIHGAKGLEWDVVFVPELERTAPVPRNHLLDWEELPDGGVVLAPVAAKGEDAQALNRWLRSLRKRRNAAERERLFYVACTRAREELHLFGIARLQASGEIRADGYSLLHAAWAAAEEHLPAIGQTSQPAVAPQLSGLSLAAGAAVPDEEAVPLLQAEEHPLLLERLPLGFRPFPTRQGRIPSSQDLPQPSAPLVSRPEGSFAARSLGTAVHIFLEEAALRLTQETTAAALLNELNTWRSRIHAVLRSNGLAPKLLESQSQTVLTALSQTLRDPIGQWLLNARTEARTELALTSWEEERRHYRIDRTFRAGAEPGLPGDQHLWIIDYKTAADSPRGDSDLAAFLERERLRYQPQLERYARVLGEPGIRLGLWFPLRSRLVWWIAGDANAASSFHEEHTVSAIR